MFCCYGRSAVRSIPSPITASTRNSSTTRWTSSSARKKHSGNWKPPLTGADTPSCSTLTHRVVASSCPSMERLHKPWRRPESEILQHAFAIACAGTLLVRVHRSQRGHGGTRGLLCPRQNRQLLARQAHPRSRYFTIHQRAASLRFLFHGPHR